MDFNKAIQYMRHILIHPGRKIGGGYFLEVGGICPICEQKVIFRSKHDWLRDHFLCSNCGSIPRERALMQVIKTYYPNYRDLKIHKSSPGDRGASIKGSVKNNLAFLHPNFTIPLTDIHSQKSSK